MHIIKYSYLKITQNLQISLVFIVIQFKFLYLPYALTADGPLNPRRIAPTVLVPGNVS
jgi:hypothetical protein